MQIKRIMSLGVAQELVARGHRVVEIKRSSREEGRLIFGFEDTESLRKDFAIIVNK